MCGGANGSEQADMICESRSTGKAEEYPSCLNRKDINELLMTKLYCMNSSNFTFFRGKLGVGSGG